MVSGICKKINPALKPVLLVKIPSSLGQSSFRAPASHNLREASQLLLATSLCGVGSVVLLPTTADAAVVATPGISPATPLTVPYNGDGIYLNVLNGASGPNGGVTPGWDFNPYGPATLQWFNQPNVSPGSLVRYSSSPSLAAGSLDLSTVVDSASLYVIAGNDDSVAIGAGAGEWKLNNANYFGFKFIDESDSLVHYGWGIMVLGDTAGTGTRAITNVFYESQPSVGIVVGDTGAVPEPTSSLLAAGAAGLSLLRRRRLAA